VERGDVYHVDLNPTQGREQAGARYMLIVSPRAFNILGTSLVCPITQGGSFARYAGFAVSLSGAGTETQGVVLCNQLRVLDLQARKAPRPKRNVYNAWAKLTASCTFSRRPLHGHHTQTLQASDVRLHRTAARKRSISGHAISLGVCCTLPSCPLFQRTV
jgi:mRNA-degrading endonuclease toxin of MazEF toxin-antitoxin module